MGFFNRQKNEEESVGEEQLKEKSGAGDLTRAIYNVAVIAVYFGGFLAFVSVFYLIYYYVAGDTTKSGMNALKDLAEGILFFCAGILTTQINKVLGKKDDD
jgi:hypothetical protein